MAAAKTPVDPLNSLPNGGRIQKLVPTPPSSAKPRPNSTRSESLKRRLKLTNSNEYSNNTTATATQRESDIAEPRMHAASIRKYDVIPPINDNALDMTENENDSKHEGNIVVNAGGVQVKRALYRKGDIFRKRGETGNAIHLTSDKSDTGSSTLVPRQPLSQYHYPSEPEVCDKERMSVAFRCPDGRRLCRSFAPSDRIGDVLVYLCHALSEENALDADSLLLSTSDVPKRNFVELNATLRESGLHDRELLNVVIDDPS
eukprot:gene15209-16780_t